MNSKTVEENVDKFVKSYISPDFSFRKYQKLITKNSEENHFSPLLFEE